MAIFFITRHSGAVDWAKANGFADAQVISHFDPATVKAGDKVIGTLPVNLAAQVCAAGAEYWHLTLNLTPEMRGKELTAADMDAAGAKVERFDVRAV